jgi:hypothetical protein
MAANGIPQPSIAAQGVSVLALLEQLKAIPGAMDLMKQQVGSAPATSEPKPRMVTQSRGKVTHDTAAKVNGRLQAPAKMAARKGKQSESFNAREYYKLDPETEIDLGNGAFLAISVAPEYWGNVLIIGLTRKAISYNPKTFAALATLDWPTMIDHVRACLPAESFSE